MKKKISSTIIMLAFILLFNLLTVHPAHAAGNDQDGNTLNIHYYVQINGVEKPLPDAGIEIVRVADIDETNGIRTVGYSLLPEYASVRKMKNGEDITFRNITVEKMIQLAENIDAIASGADGFCITDRKGMASFSELKDGMYLVRQKSSSGISEDYEHFAPYLISVPFPEIKDGKTFWKSEVLSEPKTRWSGDTNSSNPSSDEESDDSDTSEIESSSYESSSGSSESSRKSSDDTSLVSGGVSSPDDSVQTGDTRIWVLAAIAVAVFCLFVVICLQGGKEKENE